MTMSLTSPVTGTAITGLTSPTYSLVDDQSSPPGTARGYLVTALGGTQTGVNPHTIANPFKISIKGPAQVQSPGVVDATGVYRAAPKRNKYSVLVTKGAVPIAGQQPRPNTLRIEWDIEAGCETAAMAELLAMCSFGTGASTQMINGVADTIRTGSP